MNTCLQFLAVEQTVISSPFGVVNSLLLSAFIADEIQQLLAAEERPHEVFAGGAEVHTVAVERFVIAN